MEPEPGVLRELKDGLRHNRWPLLVLAAMTLLFFGRFFRSDTIFMMRDLFLKHYPLHLYASEVLKHGSLPLWNPFTGCGEPFLANIEGAVWYPPNLLYLALPVTLATALLVAFHTWLTGAAGYALCRVWNVSRLGSLLAATMLSFNTYWLTRIEFLPSHATLAWAPLVFLLYVLWARSRRARWIALAGLALGVQMLAGHPESVLFPLGAMALYALMLGMWAWQDLKRPPWRASWRAFAAPVAAFAAMVVIGAVLAMAQILPTLELVRASSIHSGVVDPEVGMASVNPTMLGTLLMPFVYGMPGYVGRYWAPACFEYWAGSFYVGAAAIVLLVGAALMWLAALGGEMKHPPEARAGAAGRPSAMPPWLRMCLSFLLYLGVLLIVMWFARKLKIGDYANTDRDPPGWIYSLGMFAFLAITIYILIRLAALVTASPRAGAPALRSSAASAPEEEPAWLRVRTPFLLVLLASATLYAMGQYTPVFNLFWHGLPFLQKFRWPSKSMVCAVFALSVLAGMALDYLREAPERTERDGRKIERELARWWLLALFVLGAALAAFCVADGRRAETGPFELATGTNPRFQSEEQFNQLELIKRPEGIVRLADLGSVKLTGGPDRTIWLSLDPAKLKAHSLTVRDVRWLLKRWHVEMAGACLGERILSEYFNLTSLEWYEGPRIPWTLLGWDAAKFAALALLAPALVLLWSSRSRLRAAAGYLLVGIAFADLFATGTALTPSGSADLLKRRSSEFTERREMDPFRIFKISSQGQYIYGERDAWVFRWAREGLAMSWPIADHVFALNAEGNFKLPGASNLTRFLDRPDPMSPLPLRLLRAAGVDRIVRFPELATYYVERQLPPEMPTAVSDAMPRACVVGGPWMLDAGRNVYGGLTNGAFPLPEAALVERSSPWAEEFTGLKPGRVAHEVTRLEYGADWNSLAIDLRSEREGILVVTDAWYPGWRATVNGRPAPVARVNALMRGVRVPAGESHVLMSYEPRTVRAGILISLAALAATILWLIFARSKPKPTNGVLTTDEHGRARTNTDTNVQERTGR